MQTTAAVLALAASAAFARDPRPPPHGTSSASPPAAAPARAAPAPAGALPPAGKEAPAAKAPLPRGAVLEEVAGVVSAVDQETHKLTVDTLSGPIVLSLDRNTMVYTARGLGTVLDLAPGQQVRAGRNADFLAYWVQLRVPVQPPASVRATTPAAPGPAGGKGPAGSSGPPPSTAPAAPARPGAAEAPPPRR